MSDSMAAILGVLIVVVPLVIAWIIDWLQGKVRDKGRTVRDAYGVVFIIVTEGERGVTYRKRGDYYTPTELTWKQAGDKFPELAEEAKARMEVQS